MLVSKKRLYFIDALRAFAILMMLQGHFVSTFLGDAFRNNNDITYSIWAYCRGFTAPVFFTITGFIFVFLLLKNPNKGLKNPRVFKGIRRGFELVIWGYLLRLNLFGLLQGKLYPAFFQTDVLHIIGLSLLILIGLYVLFHKFSSVIFQWVLIGSALTIFMLEPLYKTIELDLHPILSSYFTKANGGVFSIFPWLGYCLLGAAFAVLFSHTQKNKTTLLPYASGSLLLGLFLMFGSSYVLKGIDFIFNIPLLAMVTENNYLLIRLGNTLVLFGVFMLLENYFKKSCFLEIGQRTLSVYIIHYFVLYGTWFGLGLNRIIPHNLSTTESIAGAIVFVLVVCTLVLGYYRYGFPIERSMRKRIRLR